MRRCLPAEHGEPRAGPSLTGTASDLGQSAGMKKAGLARTLFANPKVPPYFNCALPAGRRAAVFRFALLARGTEQPGAYTNLPAGSAIGGGTIATICIRRPTWRVPHSHVLLVFVASRGP